MNFLPHNLHALPEFIFVRKIYFGPTVEHHGCLHDFAQLAEDTGAGRTFIQMCVDLGAQTVIERMVVEITQ